MKKCLKLRSNKLSILVIIVVTSLSGLKAQDPPYQFPIRPGVQNYLSGTMGELRNGHFHAGIDIKTSGTQGLPVYAAADGYVSRIKVSGSGYGNVLYIAHPQKGTTTVYGHLKKFEKDIAQFVLKEQYNRQKFEIEVYPAKNQFKIKKGQIIAYSGNSGSSGGPHLHFEIRDSEQRPVNPLKFHFKEIKDIISPTAIRMAISCREKDARVNGQFGTFEFPLYRNGKTFSPEKPVNVWGKIGLMFMGYDKLNGASNRNGIPKIQLMVDGKEQLDINIDRIPFSKTRQIETYIDYTIKQRKNRRYQKLFIDDGNTLNIYPVKHSKGYINIHDTLSHKIEIILSDIYGNKSTIRITLKGTKPTPGKKIKNNGFRPSKIRIHENILTYMTKYQRDDSVTFIHTNRLKYRVSPAYRVDNTWVYLWDLRKGVPDSIITAREVIKPEIDVVVPSGLSFIYYQPTYELHFYKRTLFDTLYMQTEYDDEIDDNLELFMLGEDVYPLQRNMKVVLKPRKTYKYPDKLSVYYTTDLKHFSFAGGQLSDDGSEMAFSTRTLGKYTLLMDTIPPSIRVIEQNTNRFRCYIRDTRSGIKSYSLVIGGEWVLLNADPKKNYYWTEKLDKTKPFKGELELKVVDQVNNIKIYKTKIE